MRRVNLLLGITLLASCDVSSNEEQRSPAHIKCWSGDRLIYDGQSTGHVIGARSSNMSMTFIDEATGKRVSLSGNCLIRYKY